MVQGKDKRNLYLAKEGDIAQGTPAWTGMSEHDRWVCFSHVLCQCEETHKRED